MKHQILYRYGVCPPETIETLRKGRDELMKLFRDDVKFIAEEYAKSGNSIGEDYKQRKAIRERCKKILEEIQAATDAEIGISDYERTRVDALFKDPWN